MSCPSFLPNSRRRKLVQAAALAVLVPAAYPVDAQIALATAINRAARFRALSQRCAKAYCQLYLKVDGGQQVLATAQRLILVGFDDLAKGGFSTAVTQQIAAIRQESDKLNQLVAAAPSSTSIVAVSQQADRMLETADRAAETLQAQAKQESSKIVNIAGRQRMLSQRIAKNYFLAAAGHETKALHDQLAQDRAQFGEALATLAAATVNTSAIRNELTLAQQQWIFFEASLARKPDEKGLREVASSSEHMLEVMNNLTSLYEGALKSALGRA